MNGQNATRPYNTHSLTIMRIIFSHLPRKSIIRIYSQLFRRYAARFKEYNNVTRPDSIVILSYSFAAKQQGLNPTVLYSTKSAREIILILKARSAKEFDRTVIRPCESPFISFRRFSAAGQNHLLGENSRMSVYIDSRE